MTGGGAAAQRSIGASGPCVHVCCNGVLALIKAQSSHGIETTPDDAPIPWTSCRSGGRTIHVLGLDTDSGCILTIHGAPGEVPPVHMYFYELTGIMITRILDAHEAARTVYRIPRWCPSRSKPISVVSTVGGLLHPCYDMLRYVTLCRYLCRAL